MRNQIRATFVVLYYLLVSSLSRRKLIPTPLKHPSRIHLHTHACPSTPGPSPASNTILRDAPPPFSRAPEIILGAKHSPALDMWSIACCLYELYTGQPLFPGEDNNDMLWRFQALRGRCVGVGRGSLCGCVCAHNHALLVWDADQRVFEYSTTWPAP